ncbi:WD repeat-containing protein jip5 [Cerrena zonata]|uniref:WD repeat-containing protein jip5 n=1 Tax=Cerrena zonata TaxID=2478898 RepID=A0AAW0FZV0_9APHY
MPAVSAYHYLTLGSTTLSHLDIRKGIITQSDDQEDELLSMCYATDQINQNQNDTVLVSHGEGIVTIWKNSKNSFRDQLSRIKVNKNASIDAIIPTMNCDDGDMIDSVWCGDSEGLLHRVNYKRGKVVETRVHSSTSGKYGAVDEVGLLDIDYDYRLISAGMDGLKIWSGQDYEDLNGDSEEDSDEDSDNDSDNEVIGSQQDDSDSKDQWEDISSDEGSNSGSEPESLGPSDFSDSEDDAEEEQQDDTKHEDQDDDQDDEQDEEEQDEEEQDEEEQDEEEQDEEEQEQKPLDIVRKKRFDPFKLNPSKKKVIDINKLTAESQPKEEESAEPEPKKKKQKIKQLSAKQLRNAQQHEQGIRRFEGL